MFSSKGESISRLVLALQAQLDSLVAHVESSNEIYISPGVPVDPALPKQGTSLDALASAILPPSNAQVQSAAIPTANAPAAAIANTSKQATRRFYGPTSPDYSLNAAAIKLRQAQSHPGASTVQEETNPSLGDDHTDDDDRTLVQESHGSVVQARLATTRLRQCIAQLPRFIARNETLRLLNVYHDAVGFLHPILNPKWLAEQAEACYADNNKSTSDTSILHEDTILILFLAISIALAAESVSQSYVGKTLYENVEHLIKLKLASEVSSPDHVLIALLAVYFPLCSASDANTDLNCSRVVHPSLLQ